MLVHGPAQTAGNQLEGLVPAGPPKTARALGPGANERPAQAFLAIDVIGELAYFAADKPGGEGILLIAVDGDQAPIADIDREAARIRAIEGTRRGDTSHGPALCQKPAPGIAARRIMRSCRESRLLPRCIVVSSEHVDIG